MLVNQLPAGAHGIQSPKTTFSKEKTARGHIRTSPFPSPFFSAKCRPVVRAATSRQEASNCFHRRISDNCVYWIEPLPLICNGPLIVVTVDPTPFCVAKLRMPLAEA